MTVEVAAVEKPLSISTVEHLSLADDVVRLNKPSLTLEFFNSPCRLDEISVSSSTSENAQDKA